ncbi:MAG: cryptochrome/photolyase family protein [Ilumatobacteraceae bacterium]
MQTVWVLGDQLNRRIGALAAARPGSHRVLLVESAGLVAGRRWHRQRLHLVLTAMRRFASELAEEGFDVDLRRAPTLIDGLTGHIADHRPSSVLVTEPNSWDLRHRLEAFDVEVVRSDQFMCHHGDFAEWAAGRRQLKMEDFYRWRRTATGYLMEGDQPAEGRWNFDADNREPPPTDGTWPGPVIDPLDDVDRAVLAELPEGCFGAEPVGLWPTSRSAALARLRHFVDEVLPVFGPHEDAMTTRSWHLAHSLLSPALNLGLLLPGEVCDAVQEAYDAGRVPIASAEGFIRQVLGWREYVWGVHWLWMPGYRSANELGASRPIPPVFVGAAPTEMRCLAEALDGVEQRAYAHHIQRLMVLGNLALLAGIDPWAMTNWMWESFVDGAEWVMLPNVIGMALHADGGRMATKPYAAGGNYIDKMSDSCGGCRFDRKQRTGPDACPYTTLYWDFVARHADRFGRNPRMARQVSAARRLSDLDAVRARADEVLAMLDRGEL